ncbi:MAG: MmgE/PrpD family protein [Chloroflexi bacterium]|nr:MmgE/PrpD family protein [Chloroflexota bacterium]
MSASSQSQRSDAIHALVRHVAATRFEDIPQSAVAAAKVFILDMLGVGLAGTLAPGVPQMRRVLRRWGGAPECSVLALGDRLPFPSAAMLNSFLMHNQEFDCVHDQAVLHPLTTALPVALAAAQIKGGVSGRDLILAAVLGVDIACAIGRASRAPMTHFRPGTAGAFAAVAAGGTILGFDESALANAMGIVYSQLCGTLQPHHEGVMVNSMQTGFNARAAATALDLAAEGVRGPSEVLEGRYGYFLLFEGEYQVDGVLAELGRVWNIEGVSHKPYPSGRLTHGSVDAALRLRDRHKIAPRDVVECRVLVPPLVHRLVGRPLDPPVLTPQYAKLSIPYVLATALIRGTVFVTDFQEAALRDSDVRGLARRIHVERNPDINDENAIVPVHLSIALRDGTTHTTTILQALGHPDVPLSRKQYLGKFRRCWAAGGQGLPEANGQRVIDMVDRLEDIASVEEVIRLLTP